MRKAVLFDCDGVIVDSEPLLAQVAARALARRGWSAQPADFAPYIGTGEDIYIGSVVRRYGGVYTPKIKNEIYADYIKVCATELNEIPGAKRLVRRLQKTELALVVASSADQIKVEANLRGIGLTPDDFTAVISGSSLERKKPFPDIYLAAARAAGAEPAECLVIEDAEAGIAAAKAAGMFALGLTSSLSRERLLASGADQVIDRLGDGFAVIERIMGLTCLPDV